MSTTSERQIPGRRERKKLQTRRALQQTALRLVAEHGFEHVTVEQIADAVDVSTRTFFNYFASKEEALIGHDPDDAVRLRDALAARPVDEAPLEALRQVLSAMAIDLAGGREERLARRALVTSEARLLAAYLAAWAAVERVLVQGIADRTRTDPERDLYPALVVSAAVSATRVAVLRWDTDEEARLHELLSLAFAALDSGLAPGAAPPKPRRSRAGARR